MPVDVRTQIEMTRPRSEVAAFASDPDNATVWYRCARGAERCRKRPGARAERFH